MTNYLRIREIDSNTGAEYSRTMIGTLRQRYESTDIDGCMEMNGQTSTHLLLFGGESDMVASVAELVDHFTTPVADHLCTNLTTDFLSHQSVLDIAAATIDAVDGWKTLMSDRILAPVEKGDIIDGARPVTGGATQKLNVLGATTAGTVFALTQIRSKKPLLIMPLVSTGTVSWTIANPTTSLGKTRNANIRVNVRNLDGMHRKLTAILFDTDSEETAGECVSPRKIIVELDGQVLYERDVPQSFVESNGEMRMDSQIVADTTPLTEGPYFIDLADRSVAFYIDTEVWDGYHGAEFTGGVDAGAITVVEDGSNFIGYPQVSTYADTLERKAAIVLTSFVKGKPIVAVVDAVL